MNHEFLIDASLAESAANFLIEIVQNSGTTYIESIELVEVNTTINSLESKVNSFYNDTIKQEHELRCKYIGVASVV
jgi:hypothetical protein